MGLIKAALNAVGGTFADQYKEIFYCDSLPDNVLLRKGQKRSGARDTNKGTDNVISDGSRVIVNEGQCLIVVDNGKIIEFSAEAGEYIYDTKTTPSLLTGGFSALGGFFKTIGQRIQTGGQAGVDQRVYYVNMKEIKGNKFGVGNIMYRDNEFKFTVTIRCFGEYSYEIANPFTFYTRIAGNVAYEFDRRELDSQLKIELQTVMQKVIREVAETARSFDEIQLYNDQIVNKANAALKEKWFEDRGISIKNVGVEVSPDEKSQEKINQFQSSRVYSDQAMGAGRMVEATASAMETAAGNSAGAMTGFMGMGMLNMMGGQANTGLAGMYPAQQQMQQPQFQPMMGQQAPQQMPQQQAPQQAPQQVAAPVGGWNCSCGKTGNTGKFCDECGAKKPEPVATVGWTCSCGTVNKGKFCAECGAKKPVAEPLYACDKCGWEPADPKNPPKFCPECGDPFDEFDIK